MNRMVCIAVVAAAFVLCSVSVQAGQGPGRSRRGGAVQTNPKPAPGADTQEQANKAAEEKARKAAAEEARRQDAERKARREAAEAKGAAKSDEAKAEKQARAETDEAVQKAKKEKAEKAAGQEAESAGSGKGKGKPEAAGQGKGKGQQAEALGKQFVHEQQKHQQRQARLERMLELAKEKGDAKTIERIESLMAKEQSRYDSKLGRMMEKDARIGQEAAAEE
ncbi:MAG TPA: hypothetical protein PK052_05300 [Anaerohalosphaeraceae bacterium]|nr:hypothetical protein [Anaerohalosphaeraceae bacterium]HOM76322.1 hypothetical protein [Anaerohalosphaeraceae bacterium]HPC64039.1 hypothetical protein [Anaerohalosphaeraceae bacterium]HRS71838.1 hypothetical protein [Anaerohalosphaeraceae bacterium]HRV20535.1 hypothetical protein [Anaerohalosphaeraceae bacterium]